MDFPAGGAAAARPRLVRGFPKRPVSAGEEANTVYEAICRICSSAEGVSKALELIADRKQKGKRLVAKHFHPILRELGRTRMVAESYALFRAMARDRDPAERSTYGTVIYSFASVGWVPRAVTAGGAQGIGPAAQLPELQPHHHGACQAAEPEAGAGAGRGDGQGRGAHRQVHVRAADPRVRCGARTSARACGPWP